jgi:probable F420-dependent oxidoreductase
MRTGILLPTFDPLRAGEPWQVVQAARRAEELGFDGVWVGDHLACPAPVLDGPTCLAAAAVATERVSLGLSVMLLALRQPAWIAKQLTTIDALSGGRLRLGVGVGGEFPEEFAAVDVPVTERGARVDDTLDVLGDLLTGRAVRHEGRALTLDVPALEPAMAAPPPIYVGGRSDHGLRRAARRGDAWLPMWLAPEAIAERAARLAALAEEHGRPCPRIALLVGVCVDDDRERARREAALLLDGQYGLPLRAVERWSALGGADEVAAYLEEHRAAGVDEVLFMPLARDRAEQAERLAEVGARLRASAGAT